jgi:hypothetical protein
MEQLITFLSSDIGKLVCYALIFVGVTDIIVLRIVFGINIKKLEEKMSPAMSPEKRKPIEKQIKNIQTIIRLTTFVGFAFIAVAVFGLTR